MPLHLATLGKLFRLIILSWIAPNNTRSISLWRTTLVNRKAKKLWNLCLSALFCAIWKERNRRLFEDQYGDTPSMWDFFLYLVASWDRYTISFSCVSFNTSSFFSFFFVIWGHFSLSGDSTPNPFSGLIYFFRRLIKKRNSRKYDLICSWSQRDECW